MTLQCACVHKKLGAGYLLKKIYERQHKGNIHWTWVELKAVIVVDSTASL